MVSRLKSRKEIASKLKDDTLDMSYCDLDEVPVRQIACISKVRNLNLSNNNLTLLPATFTTLLQIVVLDLSRNRLRELPEHFGLMTQLRHLDLYNNQISRLPLSLGELKNLRWLDLKGNPLTEAVALVAGPCNNMEDCQACARDIVKYLSIAKSLVEEERLRRLNNLTDETEKSLTTVKKEGKKKKKKNVVKECKMDDNKIEPLSQTEPQSDSTASSQHEPHRSGGICSAFRWDSCFRIEMIILIFITIYHIMTTFRFFNMLLDFASVLKDYHTC